jgi:hypothetical protein
MERRQTSRSQAQKAGVMAFEDGTSCACIVKNISRCGAKLSLLQSRLVPNEFSLTIGHTKSRVRTIWRTRFHVGVEFIAA